MRTTIVVHTALSGTNGHVIYICRDSFSMTSLSKTVLCSAYQQLRFQQCISLNFYGVTEYKEWSRSIEKHMIDLNSDLWLDFGWIMKKNVVKMENWTEMSLF